MNFLESQRRLLCVILDSDQLEASACLAKEECRISLDLYSERIKKKLEKNTWGSTYTPSNDTQGKYGNYACN